MRAKSRCTIARAIVAFLTTLQRPKAIPGDPVAISVPRLHHSRSGIAYSQYRAVFTVSTFIASSSWTAVAHCWKPLAAIYPTTEAPRVVLDKRFGTFLARHPWLDAIDVDLGLASQLSATSLVGAGSVVHCQPSFGIER